MESGNDQTFTKYPIHFINPLIEKLPETRVYLCQTVRHVKKRGVPLLCVYSLIKTHHFCLRTFKLFVWSLRGKALGLAKNKEKCREVRGTCHHMWISDGISRKICAAKSLILSILWKISLLCISFDSMVSGELFDI